MEKINEGKLLRAERKRFSESGESYLYSRKPSLKSFSQRSFNSLFLTRLKNENGCNPTWKCSSDHNHKLNLDQIRPYLDKQLNQDLYHKMLMYKLFSITKSKLKSNSYYRNY